MLYVERDVASRTFVGTNPTDDQDLTAQVQAPERLGVTPDRILGEFDFSDEKLQDTTGVLPPKKQAKIIPENWEPPNRRKKPCFNKISKILLPIRYIYAVTPHEPMLMSSQGEQIGAKIKKPNT